MSEPFVTTGEAEAHLCEKCETVTEFRKSLGLMGTVAWHASKHDAACGLPCFGAGVSLTAFRTKRFHRSMDECPICKPATAPAATPSSAPAKLPEGN